MSPVNEWLARCTNLACRHQASATNPVSQGYGNGDEAQNTGTKNERCQEFDEGFPTPFKRPWLSKASTCDRIQLLCVIDFSARRPYMKKGRQVRNSRMEPSTNDRDYRSIAAARSFLITTQVSSRFCRFGLTPTPPGTSNSVG